MADFLTPMRVSKAPKLDMERFQPGIDNLRIDVTLSSKFRAQQENLVRKMVMEDLAKQGYLEKERTASKADFDDFRAGYRGLLEGAIAHSSDQLAVEDRVLLLQLSLLKQLLSSPSAIINGLKEQLKNEADATHRDNSGRALELHERLVSIAKYEPGVSYRTLRRLFKVIQQMETKELRKIRKSVFGTSWVIPKQLLFNPLLHLPDLSSDKYLMNHYPIALMDRIAEGESIFVLTNRLFVELFHEYLPAWAMPVERESSSHEKANKEKFHVHDREWGGGFSEFLEGHRLLEHSIQSQEYKEYQVSWLDNPKNIQPFFYGTESSQWLSRLGSTGSNNQLPKAAFSRTGFHRMMAGELVKRLQKEDVLRRAIAAYRTSRLYHQLHETVPIRDIYQFLAGILSRRNLVKRLQTSAPAMSEEALRALDTVAQYIRHMSLPKQQEYASRYLKDFLTFRRDLKLAYLAYQQMSRIRLLDEQENISLSRDNGTLYEFQLNSQSAATEQKISTHVVLKADVRGSTEITEQLMQKQLNPATHFSLNFFGPINKLLERFNAQKLFVEGDALILTVLEYAGMAGNQTMCVAYACGLACKIISVMEAQNRQNRNHNLPKLELGLGISFCAESPAYLYDDRRKIMISPAINQADRLSSCAADLRKNIQWQGDKRHAVELIYTSGSNDSKQKLLRYNVNGINLDLPAFRKLRSEISMHKVPLKSLSKSSCRYYAGRFFDCLGSSHWLVVREAPIKKLTEDLSLEEVQGGAQYFYEVVTNSEIIGEIKSKLRSRRRSHESK